MKRAILANVAFISLIMAAGFAGNLILGTIFVGVFAECAFLASRQKEIDH